MSNILDQLWSMIGRLFRTNFFSVFFSNVLCKGMTFIGGMIIVRILSRNDYGQYTYVMNCYGILFLLGDLGCGVAAMQCCNEHYDDIQKFEDYFSFAVQRGVLFGGITSLLLLLSPYFYPFRTSEAAGLARTLCLMPFITITNDFLSINLRIRLKNGLFAKVNLFSTFVYYLILLPMSYWIGVRGAVLSNYVIGLLTMAYGLWLSREMMPPLRHHPALTLEEKRSFLKLAFASQVNNSVDHAFLLLDVFLIGVFIGENEVISSYKVATTIPTAMSFVPVSIMVYATPYFSRNIHDLSWVRRNYCKLILGCMAMNLLITGGFILLAPWGIPFVFGRQYADAVPCFIVLMIGYFFSASFRVPSANVIYTQRKVRVNIIITFLSGFANCVLDVVLILYHGSIGAAWATTFVHIINSVLCLCYMGFYLRKSNTGG